jgi:hypothetical protein
MTGQSAFLYGPRVSNAILDPLYFIAMTDISELGHIRNRLRFDFIVGHTLLPFPAC